MTSGSALLAVFKCTYILASTVCPVQEAEPIQHQKPDAEEDSIAGGLGLFEDEEGKDGSWAGPTTSQKPKPKKLTGPWGEYGTPAGGPAKKGSKKLPGICTAYTLCLQVLRTCSCVHAHITVHIQVEYRLSLHLLVTMVHLL